MNISLTPELEELVERKVQSGLYGSSSEVIREALRLLDERDKLKALRQDIQDGLDSGESTPLDVEAIIARGYERLLQRQQSNVG